MPEGEKDRGRRQGLLRSVFRIAEPTAYFFSRWSANESNGGYLRHANPESHKIPLRRLLAVAWLFVLPRFSKQDAWTRVVLARQSLDLRESYWSRSEIQPHEPNLTVHLSTLVWDRKDN